MYQVHTDKDNRYLVSDELEKTRKTAAITLLTVPSRHLINEGDEKHKILYSGYAVSGLRFENRTSRMRKDSANRWTLRLQKVN
jgi:hypothetical protein